MSDKKFGVKELVFHQPIRVKTVSSSYKLEHTLKSSSSIDITYSRSDQIYIVTTDTCKFICHPSNVKQAFF